MPVCARIKFPVSSGNNPEAICIGCASVSPYVSSFLLAAVLYPSVSAMITRARGLQFRTLLQVGVSGTESVYQQMITQIVNNSLQRISHSGCPPYPFNSPAISRFLKHQKSTISLWSVNRYRIQRAAIVIVFAGINILFLFAGMIAREKYDMAVRTALGCASVSPYVRIRY